MIAGAIIVQRSKPELISGLAACGLKALISQQTMSLFVCIDMQRKLKMYSKRCEALIDALLFCIQESRAWGELC